MRIAAVLAGFSMGQSDMLRKAMGKKDPKVMAKQREAFMAGARPNGVNEKKAKKIFDLMEFFAGYGFNKSHSTTYAWVAYQTAYLKANYPRALHGGAADHRSGEHRQAGDVPRASAAISASPILPPDINSSELAFTVVRRRRPLRAVRGQERRRRRDPVDARRARSELGRIDSLYTLCEHVDLRLVNKRRAREPGQGRRARFAAAGVGRHVASRRARLFAAVDRAIEHGGRHQRDREKGQSSVIRRRPRTTAARPAPCRCPTRRHGPRCSSSPVEKEALGLYMSGHPLDRFADELKTFGAQRVAELTASEADVWVGGIVSGLRPLKTKKGDRMAVFMLDDVAGGVEVVVFPGDVRQARVARSRATRCCSCAASSRKTTSRRGIVATELMPIAALKERTDRARWRSTCRCRRTAARRSRRSPSCCSRHRGDRRVSLELDVNGQPRALRVRADVAQRVRPSDDWSRSASRFAAPGSVELR